MRRVGADGGQPKVIGKYYRAVTSVQTNENWGSMETTREYYFGIGRVWLSLLEIGGVRNDVDIRSRTRFLLDIFDSVINYIEKMSI